MIYGEQAFKRFFKGLSSFPIFKKKGKNELGAYFIKNNKKDFEFYRHKIKILNIIVKLNEPNSFISSFNSTYFFIDTL